MSYKRFKYMSILAEGNCKFDCHFCVGKNSRKNITPKVSSDINKFISEFAPETNEISVSGLSTDPIFIPTNIHKNIVDEAKKHNSKIITSIHTKEIKGNKLFYLGYLYDEIVISIDENTISNISDSDAIKMYSNKIRLSITITDMNYLFFKENIENQLKNIQKKLGIRKITLRPDIYSNNNLFSLMNINEMFSTKINNSIIEIDIINDNSYSSWWCNFKDMKKEKDTVYLFSDNRVTNEDGWDKYHKEERL